MPGIQAIVLGGSWARGGADEDSDVDLGLVYDGVVGFDLDRLRSLARELDPRPDAHVPTEPGEWGPRIDGGAWLQVEGRRVDLLYRDRRRIESAVEDAIAGRVWVAHQPGHPAGYHSQTLAAEVALARPLEDPVGVVEQLRSRLVPYPERLREAILGSLWEARFALENADKPARRHDALVLALGLGRAAMTLVWVLHALNGAWLTNEKGAVAAVERLPVRPDRFRQRVEEVMSRPDAAALAVLEALVAEVEDLVASQDSRPTPAP